MRVSSELISSRCILVVFIFLPFFVAIILFVHFVLVLSSSSKTLQFVFVLKFRCELECVVIKRSLHLSNVSR